MGVRGLTSILTEAAGSQDNLHSVSGSKPIPAGSTFAVDGSGLVYYIHTLAYRAHYKNILSLVQADNTAAVEYDALISSLLPSLMPLEVMTHTCQSLLEAWVDRTGLDLCIYLDNRTFNNPFKTATSEQREDQRDEEENRLQDFLLHSSLPPSWASSSPQTDTLHNIPSADEFLDTFPRGSSKLWYLQILRDIHEFQRSHADHVTVIECQGDADIDVAFHAADDVSGNTFCVGGDSDYFIFGGESSRFAEISYIPFESLQWNEGMLEGKVWTRSSVTQLLGLPDEAALIEYSMLLGNDYTKPFLKSFQDIETRTDLFLNSEITFILSHLAWKDRIRIQLSHKGAGYRVSSNHAELDQAIRYSRDLYTFQDLSKYRTVETVEGDDNIEKEVPGLKKLIQRMGLDTFPIDAAHFQPSDTTLLLIAQHDALRYRIWGPLQQYYQSQMGGYAGNEGGRGSNDAVESSVARRFILGNWVDYITALDQSLLPKAIPSTNSIKLFPSKVNWYDYCMMALIEMLIHVAVKSSAVGSHKNTIGSLSTNITYHGIFNTHSFHTVLMGGREKTSSFKQKKKPHNKSQKSARPSPPSQSLTPSVAEKIPSVSEKIVLPIDEYKDAILQTIRNQKVTVIQGETGCGKSTRVPVMILQSPAPDPSLPRVKIFITQPRRIAAKALVEHVRASEPTLRDKFALRLGHGVREYESDSVQAWFCTTGYLVRYLARYPEKFKRVTHLIIDEVHERSVETDLLCLLTKRLVSQYPHLRLILMSATIAAEMYTEYFEVPQSPICVSARRFPIREYYLEDLHQVVSLTAKERKLIDEILVKAHKQKGPVVPSTFELEQLYNLAVYLAKAIGSHGSSILIFVAGMIDIVCISELIEKIVIPGKTFVVIPIHSDVPIEDQMLVFQPAGPNEVKVIIATNAAESSITLPDIDHVICLGICKQIMYNESSHRQVLGPTRISKASARQRAGRTGRVREGSVYRLYSRTTFELHMDPFETGEILRMPLDSVILSIKDMIPDEGISDLLSRLIEPPGQGNIERSLEALFRQKFLTAACESSNLTSLGSFVVAVGIDLCLGTFIGLGFVLGLPAESISFAAILSFPKSPWSIGNASFHEPSKYNDIIIKSYSSKFYFDCGLYSEPLAAMNMLYDYEQAKHKASFAHKYSLSLPRVKQLYSTVHHLQSRVANALGHKNDNLFRITIPPRDLPVAKITALRLLNIFAFPEFIITSVPRKQVRDDGLYRLTLKNAKQFQDDMLHGILDPVRFAYTINRKQKNIYTGNAKYDEKLSAIGPTEQRLLSYSLEKNFQVTLLYTGNDCLQAYIPHDLSEQLKHRLGPDFICTATLSCYYTESLNLRGIRGRACGFWSVERRACGFWPGEKDNVDLLSSETKTTRFVDLFTFHASHKRTKERFKELTKILTTVDVEFFALALQKLPKNTLGFTAATYGDLKGISFQDASDLFLCTELKMSAQEDGGNDSVNIDFVQYQDGSHPFLYDIPVGARILSALACGHRKKHVLALTKEVDGKEICLELQLAASETRFVDRWTTLGLKKSKVFVDNCSVPASANDIRGQNLFSCCANYLEVNGGCVKVDGLTMLPPSTDFLALAMTCVGNSIPPLLQQALTMESYLESLSEKTGIDVGCSRSGVSYDERLPDALLFCAYMSERNDTIACDENLVRQLCTIFDLEPWPLVPKI